MRDAWSGWPGRASIPRGPGRPTRSRNPETEDSVQAPFYWPTPLTLSSSCRGKPIRILQNSMWLDVVDLRTRRGAWDAIAQARYPLTGPPSMCWFSGR